LDVVLLRRDEVCDERAGVQEPGSQDRQLRSLS
jgi:hypothetical protein